MTPVEAIERIDSCISYAISVPVGYITKLVGRIEECVKKDPHFPATGVENPRPPIRPHIRLRVRQQPVQVQRRHAGPLRLQCHCGQHHGVVGTSNVLLSRRVAVRRERRLAVWVVYDRSRWRLRSWGYGYYPAVWPTQLAKV